MTPSSQLFEFSDLFVLDLANNHQGSIEHGLAVIRAHARVVQKHKVRAAFKFQFRQLDGFIHPDHATKSDNKHIPRFLSTALSKDQFAVLLDEVRSQGLLSACTPFDEKSVDLIEEMSFDIVKLASCSAKDWPLIERIAKAGRPVIFSTGGLNLEDIDNLVTFFEHRAVQFAIMHCVSIYPTQPAACQLNQIELFMQRYPGKVVGWSTHEPPQDTDPVLVAFAKGARMFERHVGFEANGVTLNAYSSTPDQLDAWLASWHKAQALCGGTVRPAPSQEEMNSIDSLQRGMYAKIALKAGTVLKQEDVFFAMPIESGQAPSGLWKPGIKLCRDIGALAPLMIADLHLPEKPEYMIIKRAVREVKAMLNRARIPLSSEFGVEYSHHYGIKSFLETGAVLITCINRQYCKKLIVQLPGQRHPLHFHKLKEESFQVLSGQLHVEIEGHLRTLNPGDIQVVLPGVWHSFWTDTGVVFEEISTTQFENDSVYADPEINRQPTSRRKTSVDHWGRFQLNEQNDEISSVTEQLS